VSQSNPPLIDFIFEIHAILQSHLLKIDLRPHSTTPTRAIPGEDRREEVGVSGESVLVSWNAAFTKLNVLATL